MLISVTLYSQNIKENGFIENKGQIIDQNGDINKNVLYLLNTRGLNVHLKNVGFSYDLYEIKKEGKSGYKKTTNLLNKQTFYDKEVDKSELYKTEFHRIDIDFINTSNNVFITTSDEIDYYLNFYTGNNSNGVTKVELFKKVIYQNLYNNIDLEFFVPIDKTKPVEYNFVIHPGGKISDIQMKISGANVNYKPLHLEIETRWGKMNEVIPLSWEEGTVKKNLKINYTKIDTNTFGYSYQDTRPKGNSTIVIDPTPVRLWATYYGGEADETQYNGDVETDSNGNIFVSGSTRSHNNIATSGSFQSTYSNSTGSWVGYLAKFLSDGNLSWATYFGDNSTTFRGITIDAEDNIIGVGDTSSSSNISTSEAHQLNLYGDPNNYNDGFIVKFNNNGTREWGTYYGGESFEGFLGVITDNNQNIYAVGQTASNENISTSGAFKEVGNVDVHSNWDSFVVKLDKNGNRQWASYYGGDGHEHFIDVDVDSFGNPYFFGTTSSRESIATSGVYQEEYSDEGSFTWDDTFLVKFTPNGERVWGTYFGGDSYDNAHGMVIDSMNNIIVSGSTRSNVFPTTQGAYQSTKEGDYYSYEGILGKFNTDGQIIWNTLYGGTESDGILNVDVDLNNNIFIVGETLSSNRIATDDSFQPTSLGNSDAFLVKFSPEGTRNWGTYYGGSSSDSGLDIEITNVGDLYMLGYTFGSTNLATSGAHQETFNGDIDNFLVKFKDCLSSITANVTTEVCIGSSIEFSATGGISYSWTGPNSFSSNDPNPIINNAELIHSGIYSVYIDSGGECNDTKTFEVNVSSFPTINNLSNIYSCEDSFGSGISSAFDTSNIHNNIVNNQTDIIVSYFDGNGNQLPTPLPNPITNSIANTETITVRVSNENNIECYVESSFDLIVESLPVLQDVDDIYACENTGYANFNLKDIETQLLSTQNDIRVKFFDGNNNLILNSALNSYTNSIINQETITLRVIDINTNCFVEDVFNLTVNPLPIAHNLDELSGCDDNNDGISEYFDTSLIEGTVLGNQTGMEVSYYLANGQHLNELPNPFTNSNPFNENIIVRVTNSTTNCYSETNLVLGTTSQPNISQPNDIYACDEGNGFSHFDTSSVESELLGNQQNLNVFYFDENGNSLPSPLPISFQNSVPYDQKIKIRVEDSSNALCFSETNFNLIVNELPEINLSESYLLCDLEPFLSLSINSSYDFYEWTFQDGSIISNSFAVNIENEGSYIVKVYKNLNGVNCYNSFNFTLVRSVLPKIESINYGEFGNNFIEIISSGSGDLEYSIDGVNYQDSNLFNNISGGIYTVYVRDKNNCGESTKEVTVLDYPVFFTPNNDGHNDYWQIKGIQNYADSSTIYIYNRYGKLLKELSSNSVGWDGTYNGRKVHSNDYWFVLILNNRRIKGHFALRR